jgi:hypothetical protein
MRGLNASWGSFRAPPAQYIVDTLKNLLRARFNLPTTESQYLDPLRTHPSIASFVFSFSFNRIVRRSVDFDIELRFGAVKIRGIDAERMLATKLHAASLSIAQQLPKKCLVARGRLSQIPGKFDRLHITHDVT